MSGANEYKIVSQHTEVSDEKLTCGGDGQTDEKPMYRVMGDHPLTQTDLVTLISDCQAAVNSRTLGYISEDAKNENELSITPFHLIHGRGIDPIPHEL